MVHAQTSVFKTEIESILHSSDVIKHIDAIEPSAELFDFMNEDFSSIKQLMYAEIGRLSKKQQFKIQHSEILERLSIASTKAWKGSQYANKKKWSSLNKHFKRAKIKLTTNFNLFKSYSFTIPLINSKGKKFYFDRNAPKGTPYLFFGKQKPRNEEDGDPEPLPFYTKEELMKLFMNNLYQNGSAKNIRKGNYRFVGVSIELNEQSVNKKLIPTARVVVFYGANRLQRVQL
jgi:hypothetical protein